MNPSRPSLGILAVNAPTTSRVGVAFCLVMASVIGSSAVAQEDGQPQAGLEDENSIAEPMPFGPDTVILRGGRIVRGIVVMEGEQRFLVLPHGRLPIPEDQVIEILLDPDEDYEPRTEREREWMARGLVPYQGSWMSPESRARRIEEQRVEIDRKRAEIEARLDISNGWSERTAHFVFRTNTSVQMLTEYAEALEAFYDLFHRRFRSPRGAAHRLPVPSVDLHRDRASYLSCGAPRASSGVFDPLEQRISLYHDRRDPEATRDVLFHETTHLLLHRMRPEFHFPMWWNEGLAEYYGATRFDQEQDRWVEGGIQPGRLVVLRRELERDRAPRLPELFATENERFGSTHYALSWALLHFLQSKERTAARTTGFLRQLVTGRGLEERSEEIAPGVVRRTIEAAQAQELLLDHLRLRTVEDLERGLRDHVAALPDPGPRGWLVAARLHLRDRRIDLAEEAALRSMESGEATASAWEIVGRVRALRQAWDRCAEAYREALQLDPLAADLHHEFGVALAGRPGVDEDLDAEARVHLHLAHELDPPEPRYRQALQRLR